MSDSDKGIDRRGFVRTSALGAAGAAMAATGIAAREATAASAQPGAREHYELRTYELRNDLDPGATAAFFERHLLPALGRAGAGPVGAFTPDVGLATATFVLVVTYPSLAAVEEVGDRLAADAAFRSAEAAWERAARTPYVRYESALYRAFTGHPRIATGPVPAAGAAGAAPATRLFELRTYEAAHATGLREKIAMFNEGEFPIFRDVGLHAVWFGEAVAAARMPHLAYMIAFDDAVARARAWSAFGAHPDWPRVRTSRTGFSDGEMVSSIRNALLRPTRWSQVR